MDISVITQQVFTVDDFVRLGCCREGVIDYRGDHFAGQSAVTRQDLEQFRVRPAEMLRALLITGFGDGDGYGYGYVYGYGDGDGDGYGSGSGSGYGSGDGYG